MYRCWNNDPSERPTAQELYDVLWNLFEIVLNMKVEDNLFQQFKIADENQEKAIISQKPELSYPYISHSQSCYISQNIYTLHGLHNSLEDIKSGKSQDPNLLKPTTSSYNVDTKESQECIDWEEEIQNRTRKRSFSTLDCNSDRGDNITKNKVKNTN
ncbi:hypothetical protein Glove_54g104 [Diversispora epigaea]|uniref:Serine-threonine/tyrosine-protein kinase catalytic domain-containing protein n=1 Tax=Diversispora epigaea TaxID=1348612 RepID=A0A397JLP1_9GLOM|nr:hypothetical protein Glove_54g104 [Diversispora epigaea]